MARLATVGCNNGTIVWSSGQIGSNEILVGQGTYSARCTNGCDTSVISNDITILEGNSPTAPIISADNQLLCGVERAILTADGCEGGTVYWSEDLGFGPSKEVGIGTYSATCTTTCGTSSNSNSITISSGATPIAPILAANKTVVCGLENAILTATGCVNGIITWSGGLGTGSIKETGAGTYTATCTNSCGTSNSSNLVIINSGTIPAAPIAIASGNIICDGDSTTLTASGCIGIITWSNGMTSSQIKISISGTFTARCTNSCGISPMSNPITISKFFTPIPPVLSVDKVNIAENDTATISVSNCIGTVRWSNNEVGASISVSQPGIYSAVCSNICGNSDSSESLEIFRNNIPNRPMVRSNKLLLLPNELAILSFENCISNVLWSNGLTTNTIEVGVGTYFVSCETSSGFFTSASITLLEFCQEICLPIQTRKIR
jgi:hypothetical protein